MLFSRDFPDPGIKPVSPASPALWVDSLPPEPPRKPDMRLVTENFLGFRFCVE